MPGRSRVAAVPLRQIRERMVVRAQRASNCYDFSRSSSDENTMCFQRIRQGKGALTIRIAKSKLVTVRYTNYTGVQMLYDYNLKPTLPDCAQDSIPDKNPLLHFSEFSSFLRFSTISGIWIIFVIHNFMTWNETLQVEGVFLVVKGPNGADNSEPREP